MVRARTVRTVRSDHVVKFDVRFAFRPAPCSIDAIDATLYCGANQDNNGWRLKVNREMNKAKQR